MTLHAFVDESYRGDYIICAALFEARSVASARAAMAALRHGSQGRIHMAKESDRRRRSLLAKIAQMGTAAQLVTVRVRGKSIRAARDAALAELASQLLDLGVSRLIIESCDQDRRDLQVIGDELARRGANGRLEIHHLRPHDEPLLWIPDAIAWAFGKGTREWRSLVDPMISRVTRL